MKTLGEAAIDLPWLAPSVASLTTLAKSPLPAAWPHLRTDPGFVLLAARALGTCAANTLPPYEHDISLLESILQHLPNLHTGFVDWNQPGPASVYRVCYRQALLASRLTEKIGGDTEQAWIAGFLAPLGWLAVAAADPQHVGAHLAEMGRHADVSAWQQQVWGHDHTAIARRLSRCWRLPSWLTAILGHLGLHVRIAERLGAQPKLFQVVQLAVLFVQQREGGLGLSVGASCAELLDALSLNSEEVEAMVDSVLEADLPAQTWEAPAQHALLPDLLRMALDQRRGNDAAWVERLQQDLDRLQEALVCQCADDQERLQTMKLSALAEFAAGAGHEINNPLAVISGQAQYALKQLEWLDGPAEEIENVGEYLGNLRAQIVPSLQKIIGQTQRIHAILTDLMQFARPSAPKQQRVSVKKLMQEVAESLQADAREHKVEVSCVEPGDELWIQADPAQVRAALTSLLRNAIEAAPAEGRASLRVELHEPGTLHVIVEDNGQGPPPSIRDHLFDPFFSGRSAGRGRGMGLPTAWRLARQQGGDVHFQGVVQGVTRFVLVLPIAVPVSPPAFVNGNGHHPASVRV